MVGFLSYDLAAAFAVGRNKNLSFPFLKENGELLCIARAQYFLMEPRAQVLYQEFYSKAKILYELYPQYYRFLLGIVLDLEDLGMPGTVGKDLCEDIKNRDLVSFDTSDMRRLEAIHLIGRGTELNQEYIDVQIELEHRFELFLRTPEHFYKFNRPLFYDLTHMVFFLTDYGRKKLTGFNTLKDCLYSVGFLAILDNDLDLLSEIIICLKFIGQSAPEFWQNTIVQEHKNIEVSFQKTFQSSLNESVDDYHIYLMANWALLNINKTAFTTRFNSKLPSFKYHNQGDSLLSKLSQTIHDQHMKITPSKYSKEKFIASLEMQERHIFDAAINSTQISNDCLNGFSNQLYANI